VLREQQAGILQVEYQARMKIAEAYHQTVMARMWFDVVFGTKLCVDFLLIPTSI
jgi:hypothetical protein